MKENRILLVRHSSAEKPDYGHWLLPAERVEPGETLHEALKREIDEETGLEIRIVRKVDERVDPYTGDPLTNFLCVPLTSRIETSSELMDTRWFDRNGVSGLEDIHEGLKRFLIEGLGTGSFS